MAYELPPWLTQPADPTGSFLKGTTAGTAIAGNFERGRRLAIAQAELPYKFREMDQEAEMRALKLDEALRNRDDMLEGERQMKAISSQVGDMFKTGNNAKAQDFLIEQSARNPNLMDNPRWMKLMDQANKSVAAETARKQIAASIERANISADSRWDIERARQEALADPNNLQNWIKLSNLQARFMGLDVAEGNLAQRKENTGLRRNAAVQSATRTEADLRQQGFRPAQPLEPPPPPGQEAFAPTPGQPLENPVPQAGPPRSLLIPTERPATTATVTDNQKRVQADEVALETLGEALDFVTKRPEAFGPQGVALAAAEKAKSIATSGKSPMPITEARQSALRNFITMADGLRVDSGNMNQKELQLLKEAGDVRGFLDDPGSARTKLQGLMTLKLQQLKNRYDILQRAPPAGLLKSLSDQSLADAVIIGLFSRAQAEAEFKRRHP